MSFDKAIAYAKKKGGKKPMPQGKQKGKVDPKGQGKFPQSDMNRFAAFKKGGKR